MIALLYRRPLPTSPFSPRAFGAAHTDAHQCAAAPAPYRERADSGLRLVPSSIGHPSQAIRVSDRNPLSAQVSDLCPVKGTAYRHLAVNAAALAALRVLPIVRPISSIPGIKAGKGTGTSMQMPSRSEERGDRLRLLRSSTIRHFTSPTSEGGEQVTETEWTLIQMVDGEVRENTVDITTDALVVTLQRRGPYSDRAMRLMKQLVGDPDEAA